VSVAAATVKRTLQVFECRGRMLVTMTADHIGMALTWPASPVKL
jgi:hypothetical protein